MVRTLRPCFLEGGRVPGVGGDRWPLRDGGEKDGIRQRVWEGDY